MRKYEGKPLKRKVVKWVTTIAFASAALIPTALGFWLVIGAPTEREMALMWVSIVFATAVEVESFI